VPCKHKSCSYYGWSSWSATCGSVERSRKRYSLKDVTTYVKESKDCDKYPKSCELYDKQTKTLAKCPIRCLNKKCYYYSWSSWSATCGNGVKRTRRFRYSSNSYYKVKAVSECVKYTTACDNTLIETKNLAKCPGKSISFFLISYGIEYYNSRTCTTHWAQLQCLQIIHRPNCRPP
uniref:Uncharacterized protein n=1 Tax=Clytia hemisphaerica TaxID=252671 RepID=A0A7M5XNG4_9CNID